MFPVRYYNHLVAAACERISSRINLDDITMIVEDINQYYQSPRGVVSHNWYLNVSGNIFSILNQRDFFFNFQKFYRLRFSLTYRAILEGNLERLIWLFENNEIETMYSEYFERNDANVMRNEGSAFCKLLHTFSPVEHPALDTTVKNWLGLKSESYFIAQAIVKDAYNEWICNNQDVITIYRNQLSLNEELQVDNLSDFKVINMALWNLDA